MSKQLLKDPAEAMKQLREFQRELERLQSKYIFSELAKADTDHGETLLMPLYKVEKSCMVLLDKLVALNAEKNALGCKVKEIKKEESYAA